MKRVLIILICIQIVQIPVKAQSRELPGDIQQYYMEKNFVSTYSFKSERDLINIGILKRMELPEFQSDRLKRIAKIMLELSEKILLQSKMPADTGIPFELLLPEIDKVYDWENTDNKITVQVQTFSIGPENNLKLVKSYSQDKLPSDVETMDLSLLKFSSRQIHSWYYVNNSWHKSSVNRVLCE